MSLLIAIDDVGEGLAVKYAVVFTDCDRIVGNPSLIPLRKSCPSSARNRGKLRMNLPILRKPTLGVWGSASVRFTSERGCDRLR
jgi:hypothetical protein